MRLSDKSSNRIRPFHILILALLVVIAWSPVNVFAAAFVVTNGNASGAGSLRQAVLDANANGNPGVVDTITFDAAVTRIEQFDLDKGFAAGPIPITQSVNISGPGRPPMAPPPLTIDGGYSWISSGGALNIGYPQDQDNTVLLDSDVLFDVGIRDTDNSGISVSLSGFGLRHSGGLVRARSGANITIADLIMVDNAFPVFSGRASCGMICTDDGNLTVTNVGIVFTDWDSSSHLVFSDSNNTSIDRLVMQSNSYKNFGGLWAANGVTEIINSEFSDNDVQHQFTGDSAYISNTVFRRPPGSYFLSLIAVFEVDIHLNNVTIYGEVTDENDLVDQPSHLWLVVSTLQMANTVIAAGLYNPANPIQELARLEGTTIALNSNNHVDDGSMPSATTGDAGLELLALGFKPKPGSILIDAGNDIYAVNPLGGAPLTEDILGASRISGPSVDVGAVEVQENWAVNDAYTTPENVALTVAAPGALSNDQLIGTLSPDNIIVAAPPQHGTLVSDGLSGGFLYTPDPGFFGTDSFLYRFSTDSAATSNEATVSIVVSPLDPRYSLGGILSGLITADSVIIQNNGGDSLTLRSDGAFSFPSTLANGDNYLVTVLTQPAGESCSVVNESGTISGADVSNVSVICTVNSYTVGGSLSGLASGEMVVLQNNGADNLTRSANGAFTFSAPLADATGYSVSIATQPTGQTCSVTDGDGTLSGANVSSVSVGCVDDPVTPPTPTPPRPVPAMRLWLVGLMAMLLAGISSRRLRKA